MGAFQAAGYSITWTDTPGYTDFTFVCTSLPTSALTGSSRRKRRDITVTGVNNFYIALGLSTDQRMSNDDVVACKITGSNATVEHYYNSGRVPPTHVDDSNLSIGLSNANVVYNGTALVCSFRRDKSTYNSSRYFDLNNNYYLLIAQGAVTSTLTTLLFHKISF